MTNQRGLFRILEQHGWVISQTNGNHYKLTPPDPGMKLIICSMSPSDHRVFHNIRSDVRRAYSQVGKRAPV